MARGWQVSGSQPFDDREKARAAGRRGGHARAARHLSLEKVEAALPPLTDIESAMHRLDVVARWALAGMVPGAIASAAVRSCEVWLKGAESKLTREVVDQLRARLADLEHQVAQPRLGRVP